MTNYQESIAKGIAHNKPRYLDNNESAIQHILKNTGNPIACLNSLSVKHKSGVLVEWFENSDLLKCKSNAFIAAKLFALAVYRKTHELDELYFNSTFRHFYPLLSDAEELICWSMQNESCVGGIVKGKRACLDTNKFEYHSTNTLLALRGEFELLKKRSEYILDNPTTKPRLKRYMRDYEYFIALADHDIEGIQRNLDELTSNKVARVRNKEFEFGLEENMVAVVAFIFAKIAWRHGLEVEVKSPWVPDEWLPITPLDVYEQPYKFLEAHNIYSNYGGVFESCTPKLERSDFRDLSSIIDPYL